MNADKATALRAPFKKEQIGKLPKGGVTLDFVGHAATTDRLLSVDPDWTWEPFAVDERGLPRLDEFGGLWIRLTVCGVTRIGYGDAGGKKGNNAVKEAIGDALRNAAMRFGVAIDLWAKQDLLAGSDSHEAPQSSRSKIQPATWERIANAAKALNWTKDVLLDDYAATHSGVKLETISEDDALAYAGVLENLLPQAGEAA